MTFVIPLSAPAQSWFIPDHLRKARLHLDTLWWTALAETSDRGIYRRTGSRALVSSAKPTTGVQVVRAFRPSCLNSLALDARRADSFPHLEDVITHLFRDA